MHARNAHQGARHCIAHSIHGSSPGPVLVSLGSFVSEIRLWDGWATYPFPGPQESRQCCGWAVRRARCSERNAGCADRGSASRPKKWQSFFRNSNLTYICGLHSTTAKLSVMLAHSFWDALASELRH